MAGRIPFSGYNDEAIEDTNAKSVSSDADFATQDKTFWLRGISISNDHATETATVTFYDSDEAALAGIAATARCSIIIGPQDTVVADYSAPGIPFRTEVCAGDDAAGTFATYSVSVWGYLE